LKGSEIDDPARPVTAVGPAVPFGNLATVAVWSRRR